MRRAGRRCIAVLVAGAAGQLDHIELSEKDGAGIAQPRDDGGVVLEDLVRKESGSPSRRDAPRREEIFHRVGYSMERPEVGSMLNFKIDPLGFLSRSILRDSNERVD